MGWETYDEDMKRDFDREVREEQATGGKDCPTCGAKMSPDYGQMTFRCWSCEENRNAPCSHPSTTRMYDPGEHEGLGAVNVCDVCGEVV